jgi:hypothetical protein
MGMYTELIFGACLKPETPNEVIENIKYLIGENENDNPNFLFKTKSGRRFWGSSYYFLPLVVNKMYFDKIHNGWIVSIRCSLKNYENEIEDFLTWIKPYIESASGARNMYEEAEEPTIYYLNEKEV